MQRAWGSRKFKRSRNKIRGDVSKKVFMKQGFSVIWLEATQIIRICFRKLTDLVNKFEISSDVRVL
jgi:hypothetical protein